MLTSSLTGNGGQEQQRQSPKNKLKAGVLAAQEVPAV